MIKKEIGGKEHNIITTHGNYLSTDPSRLKITGESRKRNFIYGKSEMQIIKDNYFLNEILKYILFL